MKKILKIGLRTLIAALFLAGLTLDAQAAEHVTIAYQTTVEPSKVAQADGAYEKTTGQTIDWRKFDTGAEVIAAVASGDVLSLPRFSSGANVAGVAPGSSRTPAWIDATRINCS